MKQILHNRFLLNRSILTFLWGLYVTFHLYSEGWEIPKTSLHFIVYNNATMGLNVAFILVGLFGICTTLSKRNESLMKLITLIGILMLWSGLSFIFIMKDVTILHKITFSTVLVLSIPVSTIIEILVGDRL